MKKDFILSENEGQIMDTLWKAGESMLQSEMLEFTENKTWKESSIHILLNQLLEKGAIEVDGFKQAKKNYGRTYSPTITREEYDLMQLNMEFEKVDSKKSVLTAFISNLVKSEEFDKECKRTIISWI